MGKHTKQKKRVTGTQKKTSRPVFDEKVHNEKVLPVIGALKSVNANERLSALSALGTLIEDNDVRHMLLRERLIKIILTNILSDSSLEARSQGFGLLRNIVLLEGRDPALYLWRENIKLPLEDMASKILESLSSSQSSMEKEEQRILNQMCENVCGLLSSIEMYLGNVKEIPKTLKLALLLADKVDTLDNGSLLDVRSIEAAYELLYYLSENSSDILIELIGEESLLKLKTKAVSASQSTWAIRIYGLGLEFNALIMTGKSTESVEAVAQLVSFLTEAPKSEISSIQICLELLAIVAQTEELEVATYLSSKVFDLISDELLEISNLKLQSVSVLNNIGWSLNYLGEQWASEAEKIYARTLSLCFTDLTNTELVSSALGLITATLAQNPGMTESHNFRNVLTGLLERTDALYKDGDEEWIGLARALVLVLGSCNGLAIKFDLLRPATQLIFSLLETSKDAEILVDTLDALFDLHGDNDAPYNQSEYVQQNLNERLEQLKPDLKRVLKSVPKSEMGLKAQASDALTNLENFIVYKRA